VAAAKNVVGAPKGHLPKAPYGLRIEGRNPDINAESCEVGKNVGEQAKAADFNGVYSEGKFGNA